MDPRLARVTTIPAWFGERRAETRLAVRVAVAGAATYFLAHALGLAQGYWAVFTAVIVMQASVGGSLKATVDRLIGTLGGAIYGGAIALAVRHGGPLVIGIALVVALLPLAFVAAIDARFRVAPITAVIVLVSPFGGDVNPIWFTIDRVGEITLGSVVALLVSLTVLPARAHGVLATQSARLCGLLASFLALILGGIDAPVDGGKLRRLQIGTRRLLVAIEAAAEEAQRERSIHLTDEPDPEPIARTGQRIRNDLIIMARALTRPLPEPMAVRLKPSLAAVATEGRALLNGLAAAFAQRTLPPAADAFQTALRRYHGEMSALTREHVLDDLPGDLTGHLFALSFALDQFGKDAGDLADRVAEYARPATASGSA